MISRWVVLAIYAALAAAVLILIAFGHRPGSRLVPLATLLQTMLASRPVRVVIVLFWWWLGWHFLVEP